MARKSKSEVEISYNCVVPRDIFSFKLSISEIRLCVYLTSKKCKNINNLSYEEKMYICGCRAEYIDNLSVYNENLIKIGLLDEEGYGVSLSKTKKMSFSIRPDEFYLCKNLRDLFVLCVPVWVGRNSKFATITDDELETIFTKRNFSKYFKNLNDRLMKGKGMYLSYEKTYNSHKFTIIECNNVPSNIVPPCDEVIMENIKINNNKKSFPTINIKTYQNIPVPPSLFPEDIDGEYLD